MKEQGEPDCKPVKHGIIFFFEWPNWKKKSQSFFVCFHIPNVCRKHHWWYAALHDRALLRSYTLVLHWKCSKMSQDSHGQTGDAKSGPSLGSSNCLCVNVYYVRREALWACASTCVQGHAHRQRQGGPGILRQEARRLGFEFSTPERKPSFSLTFYNATLKQFCLALFILNRRKEIQHLRKLNVT